MSSPRQLECPLQRKKDLWKVLAGFEAWGLMHNPIRKVGKMKAKRHIGTNWVNKDGGTPPKAYNCVK